MGDFIPLQRQRYFRGKNQLLFPDLRFYKAATRSPYIKSRIDYLPRYCFFPKMTGKTILGLPWFSEVQREVFEFWFHNFEKRDVLKVRSTTQWIVGYRCDPEFDSLLFIVLVPYWLYKVLKGSNFDGVPAWLSFEDQTSLNIAPSLPFEQFAQDNPNDRGFSLVVDSLDFFPRLCETKLAHRDENYIAVPKYFVSPQDFDKVADNVAPPERHFPADGKLPFVLLYNNLGVLIFFRASYVYRRFKRADGIQELFDDPLPSLPEGCFFLNIPEEL